jgi:hypothetical protein
MASDFYRYFKEDMDSLGAPCPESLFGSVTAAVATAKLILEQVDKFGPRVTVAELAGAGSGLEALAFGSAIMASFYVGPVIGSLAVATGRTLFGGTSLADVLMVIHNYHLNRPWLHATLVRNPMLYQSNSPDRRGYLYLINTGMFAQ